jgi:hypothetical protein
MTRRFVFRGKLAAIAVAALPHNESENLGQRERNGGSRLVELEF